MSFDLKFRKTDFPSDWSDDVRMNFLFGAFRERSVNPEGYDAKLNFWMNTIQDICVKSQSAIIGHSALCLALERNNRQPQCLDIVLENMLKHNLVVSLNEFQKFEPEKGWLSWSLELLVQKPISWSLSSIQGILNWNRKDDNFIVLAVVKDIAAKLWRRYYDLVNTKWTDNAVFLEHFRQECKDLCTDSNFQLAVLQLQKERMAQVYEEFGEKVIKFRQYEEKPIEPLSELDKGILSLNRARDKITEDLDVLEENVEKCDATLRELVGKGLKNKAMLLLKKKKRIEFAIKKKGASLDNIENLLCQLKNAGSEKMVLDAYRTGVQAMKGTNAKELDLDNVDEVMADVKDALDDYTEVQRSLSRSIAAEEEEEDLEAELEDLLAEEEDAAQSENTRRISDDDLMRRLAALRAPPEDVPPVKKQALNKPLRAP